MPVKHFPGKIHVIRSRSALEEILPHIRQEKILGFDTETRPSFKKGKKNKVALLQLSGLHTAYLIRLNYTGLPAEIKKIFEDTEIIKVGAAIRDDLRALKKLSPFEASGFIELQDFVKDFGIENNGLKKLSAIVLGFRISKSQQLSNWESEELTEAQQVYAATDAWVCKRIYQTLINHE